MSDGLQSAGRREAPVVGITGNIGTGKSTVASLLAALGVHVVDADKVVHGLYRDPESALVQAVAAEFGQEVLARDGSLDRAALARVVFSDAAALDKLEVMVHPAVVAQVQKEIDRAPGHVPIAIEAIKLIESDLVKMLDAVWIVEAPVNVLRDRLSAKGMSVAELQQRLEMQTSVEEKVAHLRRRRGAACPVAIICNAGTLVDLRSIVSQEWRAMQDTMGENRES